MKALRLAVSFSIVFSVAASLFAVNDLWLGPLFAVSVKFSAKTERFVDPPHLKILSMPSYPPGPFEAFVSGNAAIRFVVGVDGTVTDVHVSSTSVEEFGIEAKKTVQMWLFTPGRDRRSGEPRPFEMECRFEFQMTEQ